MRPHVAFVGPELFSAYTDMVRGLKEAGALVTGVGGRPAAAVDEPLRRHLDGWVHADDLGSRDGLVAAVRALSARRGVDLLETGDEALVLPVAQAREALGLPGLSVRTATLCRDKAAMKETLRAAGVPCAASEAVSSVAALRAFAEREGFPVIVKPRAALGGLGTVRCTDVAGLEAAASRLGLGQGASVQVEEFVVGHEGFYDTLAVDGTPVVEFVAHYYPTVLSALDDRRVAPQIAATNRADEPAYDALKAMGRTVIRTLGIGTSATHMEWFFGPKGLKFSEIGARPPGERIYDLHSAGNDLDVWAEWAQVLLHRRVTRPPSRRFATGSVQVRPPRDGRVVGYDGLEHVMAALRPHLFAHRVPAPGTPTDPIHKGYLNNVWFRLRHADYDALRELMTFAGERLTVHVA
ncbi:MAG: ATP-grasp domain-containing protein [Planctomycetes bacterium]|nr:ATP-grasp domain-containing protein [Planctomycetota bacterium]